MRRCGNLKPGALGHFPNLEVIFNLGAGVDAVVFRLTLPHSAIGAGGRRRSHQADDRIRGDACADASPAAGLLCGEPAAARSGRRSCNGRRATCALASWVLACSGATRQKCWRASASMSPGWSSTWKSISGIKCYAGESPARLIFSYVRMCSSACCRSRRRRAASSIAGRSPQACARRQARRAGRYQCGPRRIAERGRSAGGARRRDAGGCDP